jgi:pseudouridylate synthase
VNRLSSFLSVREDVAEALASGSPVVALESTVFAHGLPRPHNLATARKMEAAVSEAGALPATIGILDRKLVIGLSHAQIAYLSEAGQVAKVSRADLSSVLASGGPGATTVAGTAFIAALAGIRVFATGGIGGVHRGVESSLDISADLTELARTPVAVVCSGSKAILDLPRTLELLETLGVPVVGYGTREFPAFYSRQSGLQLIYHVDTPDEAANLMDIQWGLGRRDQGPPEEGMTTGIVFANPPPSENAMSREQIETLIAAALKAAQVLAVRGKKVTPFLLQQLEQLSGGETLQTNMALLIANASLAGAIAVSFSTRRKAQRG